MMDLNIFDRGKESSSTSFIKEFIDELKGLLESKKNKINNNDIDDVMDDYNLYERRKVFLDNKSFNGNDLAWVMDETSVCISEDGEGGPFFIDECNLPKDAKVGDVYEKIDGKYVYNEKLSVELGRVR